MAHVVFLRAANVGGKNVFRPAQLAASLKHLDVVNIGAAGTFVVRGKASASAIRREILAKVPFELEIVVCPRSKSSNAESQAVMTPMASGFTMGESRATTNWCGTTVGVQPLRANRSLTPATKVTSTSVALSSSTSRPSDCVPSSARLRASRNVFGVRPGETTASETQPRGSIAYQSSCTS